jgi:fructosamine-3-kinase
MPSRLDFALASSVAGYPAGIDESSVFVKRRPEAPPDFFRAEAAGLAWLAAAGAPVVAVREVGDHHIVLQRVHTGQPNNRAAAALGAALASMHDSGADCFGCPPEGFSGQLYIGNRPMPSHHHLTWGRFYVEDRVLPFLKIAVDVGNVTASERDDIEAACAAVDGGAFDGHAPPARLHGDLWSGNILWTPDRAVLIDPAAHGGHRETDLAMLELFGCPHLDAVLAGYADATPLRDGWRDRIPLHQLHPLAVHAAGHGRGYGRALHRAALHTLRMV